MDAKGDEYGVSAVALDALEHDFVEVMKELSAEDNLERFRVEYEKLHRALKKSHDSEKRLIKKCQELHQEIMQNANKVQAALRLSQDDENTIVSLRKEIEKAWKMVDAAQEKERGAKDTIQLLKKEVARLTSLVEQGSGYTEGQETSLQDLIEEKKEFTKERDLLMQKVQQQAHELRDLRDSVGRADTDVQQRDRELEQRTKALADLQKAHENEAHTRTDAESRVKQLGGKITEAADDLTGRRGDIAHCVDHLGLLARELRDKQMRADQLVAEINEKQKRVDDMWEKAHRISTAVDQVNAERDALQQQMGKRQQERTKLADRIDRFRRDQGAQEEAIRRIEGEKAAAAQRIAAHQGTIAGVNSQLEGVQRSVEEAERRVKDRVRDKNLGVTKAVKDEGKRVELDAAKQIENGKNRSLHQELEAHRAEGHALKRELYDLARQRASYQASATDATERFSGALEDVKGGKRRVADLQAELEEARRRLKNQQAMYEQVLADRNLYAKNHNEAKEEIEELDRKFKVLDQQIAQLKEELRRRENDLMASYHRGEEVVKEHKAAEERVRHLEGNLREARSRGSQLGDEIKQLAQIIADCDGERAKQRMKFNSVTNERNILATQLIRRNEELSLLYEKIRVQQSTLLKGESQYRERLVDIGMLRRKAHELRAGLGTSRARILYVDEMKRQITALQRQLIQERTRVKALFEELQNPMNVHRWRKLEGSDPQEHENIQKLHTLQKRLIDKTEESRQKDLMIRDKDRQYSDLKAVLARQPGPEIAEQLAAYHDTIEKREEQLRRMAAELDANRGQVSTSRIDVDRVQTELGDVKKKFFTLKSKNSLLLREATLAVDRAGSGAGGEFQVHHPASQTRYAGGGFCLSVSSAVSQRPQQ